MRIEEEYWLYLDVDLDGSGGGILRIIPLPIDQLELLDNGQYEWKIGGLTFENWQIAHNTEIDKLVKIHLDRKKVK